MVSSNALVYLGRAQQRLREACLDLSEAVLETDLARVRDIRNQAEELAIPLIEQIDAVLKRRKDDHPTG